MADGFDDYGVFEDADGVYGGELPFGAVSHKMQ
jgi:hypothetical protein